MAQIDPPAVQGKPFRQPLGDEYGAMPPAGAAHGQGQIALSLALIARQQRQQQIRQMLEEAAGSAGSASI